MGKKKSKSTMVPVASAVPAKVHKELEKLVKQTPGASVASLVRDLITDHVDTSKGNAIEKEDLEEEALLRLLTHFEERIAERIVALNFNLRQATGLILTPKPPPSVAPPEDLEINSSIDAKHLIECTFRELIQ